jgi:hypothetical protein
MVVLGVGGRSRSEEKFKSGTFDSTADRHFGEAQLAQAEPSERGMTLFEATIVPALGGSRGMRALPQGHEDRSPNDSRFR